MHHQDRQEHFVTPQRMVEGRFGDQGSTVAAFQVAVTGLPTAASNFTATAQLVDVTRVRRVHAR
jgi:hypothetical protein